MRLTLHVYITTGTLVLIKLHKKADLLEIKINSTKDIKVHMDKLGFDLEKNGGHTPSSSGSRSTLAGREAGR